jgi:hypothetical protein
MEKITQAFRFQRRGFGADEIKAFLEKANTERSMATPARRGDWLRTFRDWLLGIAMIFHQPINRAGSRAA